MMLPISSSWQAKIAFTSTNGSTQDASSMVSTPQEFIHGKKLRNKAQGSSELVAVLARYDKWRSDSLGVSLRERRLTFTN